MKLFSKYFILFAILPIIIYLSGCSKTAENEHLPEYCQTYSGFISTASKDLYDLLEDVNRFNYLSVISEIELEFIVEDPTREIDLNGIQCFQNLTSLTLIGESFKDISPISALKNIQKIVLIDTSIVSIDSFKNLSKVNFLTISNTKTLQSVDGIEEMTKLTSLDLSYNGIVNIDGLNNLINLTELFLSHNSITHFPSINQLDKLVTLDVSYNTIETLGSDLSGLSNLREFSARNNNIRDISTLDDLISLEILDLSENDLGYSSESPNFEGLINAHNLRELYLNDNNLASISDLAGKNLPLEILHLHNNILTDITPIGAYTTIEELVLYNNNISNIDDLSGMLNLSEIDLSENLITDFTDLLTMPNLEFVYLDNNLITFIPDMSTSLPNLRILDLESNFITDSSGIEGHQNIRELILRNNGMEELTGISNLPFLNSLNLYQDIPEEIPEDFIYDDNPNNIWIIRDSFNFLPRLTLTDEDNVFDFGFDLGSNAEIYNSISDIDNVGTIDFSDMDINVIDEFSINIPSLIRLDVSGNNVTDISFILGNPNLNILYIYDNNISNLSVISGLNTSDLDNVTIIDASNITGANNLDSAFIQLPLLEYLNLNGTNIVTINNSFNDLIVLDNLGIDSDNIESITDSFNGLFPVYSSNNVVTLNDSKISEINNSFNGGIYEQINIINNTPEVPTTSIIDSFNDIEVRNIVSIAITYNDFKDIQNSFNNVIAETVSLMNNNTDSITGSFASSNIAAELNIQNNNLQDFVGLNSILYLNTFIISNNKLVTVSFLDGITGLETLDLSNQYDIDLEVLTLTDIDGINNMPLLTSITMDDMAITSIDGFKDIGIDNLILSTAVNRSVAITSITSDSFSNSLITTLDLIGHNFTNIDFLDNFSLLTDLSISIDIVDLSDFQSSSYEYILDSLYLENIQEVTTFSYLSGYDVLTYFGFSGALTNSINDLDGLDSLNVTFFNDMSAITAINNSFNNMNSLNLTQSYVTNFTGLTNITNSFDVYDALDTVEIEGTIIIVDSFNNVGSVILDNGALTIVNFDNTSFDNVDTFNILDSSILSYAFLNGYAFLDSLSITTLRANITDLVNENITFVDITDLDLIVDTLTIDIADSGSLHFSSSPLATVSITADNAVFDMNSTDGVVNLILDNIDVTLMGSLGTFTLDSTNLVSVSLFSFTTTNMTFNADNLNSIQTLNSITHNAVNMDINSIEASLDINVRADIVNLYDDFTNIYDLTVLGGNANLFSLQPNLTVDFTGVDLNVTYDAIETIEFYGNSSGNVLINSTNVDYINFNNAIFNTVNISSNQALVDFIGSNVSTLNLTNNSITDVSLDLTGTDILITSTNVSPLNIDVNANSLDIDNSAIQSITFDTTSSLSNLDLSSGASIDTLNFSNANITNTHLISNEVALSIYGTNNLFMDLDVDNMNNIVIDAANSTFDIDSLSITINGDIIASSIDLDGTNLTDVILTNETVISTLNIMNSSLVDTITLNNGNVGILNIDSNSSSLSLSGVNIAETYVSGNNYINVQAILDPINSSLIVDTSRISDMTFDVISKDVTINSSLNIIVMSGSSTIDVLEINSPNLDSILSTTASLNEVNVNSSDASLTVSGINISTLTVNSSFTSFIASVTIDTIVDLTTTSISPVDINTNTEGISISSASDVTLISNDLTSSNISIGSNNITLNLSAPSLDFTINGVMGEATVDSSTMNNLIIGEGTDIDKLDITNDNIMNIDLSPGTVRNLDFTSLNTAMDILGNDLIVVNLFMDNLSSLTVNSTNVNSEININTTVTTLDLNGSIDNVLVTGNNLTSLDLTNALYYNLSLIDVDSLAALNTLSSISNSLYISSSVDNFNLITDVPTINFTGVTTNNVILNSTATAISLITNVNTVTLDVVLTDLTLSGTNLTQVNGDAQNVLVLGLTDSISINFDLDTNNLEIISESPNQILIGGTGIVSSLIVQSASVSTINTNDNVSTDINIIDSRDDLNIITNTPILSVNTDILYNVNINSSAAIIDITSNTSDVTLNGLTTDFTVSGPNLDYIYGDVKSITIPNEVTSNVLSFDIAAETVLINSSSQLILFFEGIDVIGTIDVISSSSLTINTFTKTVGTLNCIHSGTQLLDVTTHSPIVNLTGNTTHDTNLDYGGTVELSLTLDGINDIALFGNGSNVVDLNYQGSEDFTIYLNNINSVSIALSLSNIFTASGIVADMSFNGPSVDTANLGSLTINNSLTITNSLFTDLEFISSSLLSSLNEITIGTLTTDNVDLIISKLSGTGIILYSPITLSDISDYFYDYEHSRLTVQEGIDNVRYDLFRGVAITDAYDEIMSNIYMQYLEEIALKSTIDTQSYLSMQAYFDGYVADIGTTEAQLIIDEGQAYVDAIKAYIQATLDQSILIIVEQDLIDSVANSIILDATNYSITETANIGFVIG